MARTVPAPTLYQEVRISPAPTSPSSVLQIQTNNSSQLTLFGAGRKRAFDEISGLDEESYARKHLASEGSVYFRRKGRSPRSFLWRVLDDRQLLEVQCVDLVQEEKHRENESWLKFQISLPAPILRGGVAFADPEDTDALEVFVLTATELYTIVLKRDLLTRDAPPKDFDPSAHVKKFAPSSFHFRHPYRFVAANSLELLVSLHDGGLMRLERQAREHGGQWHETYFTEGGWSGTLRGLLPLKRHQTVRYGDLELEPSCAAAIAMSPDGNFVWTVTLDHMLKAWSTKTGKVVEQMDLLNEKAERDAHRRQSQYIMPAESGQLLQMIPVTAIAGNNAVTRKDEHRHYFLVVHSPKEHELKIYQISTTSSSAEGENIQAVDLLRGVKLVPPMEELLNTNIWHLEEFHVRPGSDWENTELWIRARSGALCKIYNITIDLLDDDLEVAWQNGWTVVDAGPSTTSRLRDITGYPTLTDVASDISSTPSEAWLDFLFYPGRFSKASLETALSTYCKRRKLPKSSSKGLSAKETLLKDRLTSAISSKLILHRLPSEHPDYDRYQADIHTQWQGYYSILEDMHKRRSESIGFAFDPSDGLAWGVAADFVCPIRYNDTIERLSLNTELLVDNRLQGVDQSIGDQVAATNEDVAIGALMAAAHQFRSSLSATFQQMFQAALADDALGADQDDQSPRHPQTIYDKCHLSTEVTEDVFATLESSMEALGGLGNLDDRLFTSIVDILDHVEPTGPSPKLYLTHSGERLTIKCTQQILERFQQVLLDLTALVSFMAGDLEPGELHEDFTSGKLFRILAIRLRQCELRQWLVGKACLMPVHHGDGEKFQATVFEGFFMGDWESGNKRKGVSSPELLTIWSRRWTFGIDLHSDWIGVTSHVFAELIRNGLFDLAADFSRFLNDTPWNSYLKGRLRIGLGEYELASLDFQAAAQDQLVSAATFGKTMPDSANILSAEEKSFFGAGSEQYYQHVAHLFEMLKVYSYTTDFASLALQHLEDPDPELVAIDKRKHQPDSPASVMLEATMEEIRLLKIKNIRNEIVGRLFYALVQTGRFRPAFDALLKITEPALLRSNMEKLIDGCVKQDCVPTLLELPFEGHVIEVADAILLKLAKKNLASGLFSVTNTTPAYQVLYAFRLQRGNFRGAAEVLYEHLERLRHSNKHDALRDPEDETLLQAYLLLINTLACCGEEEAWLLAEPLQGVHETTVKRKLVRLEDVRREYEAELDKRSDVIQGRFPLSGGFGEDEMDVL